MRCRLPLMPSLLPCWNSSGKGPTGILQPSFLMIRVALMLTCIRDPCRLGMAVIMFCWCKDSPGCHSFWAAAVLGVLQQEIANEVSCHLLASGTAASCVWQHCSNTVHGLLPEAQHACSSIAAHLSTTVMSCSTVSRHKTASHMRAAVKFGEKPR